MTGFGRAIEGSRGTFVFGNGVPAVTGEVTTINDDHVMVETTTRDGYEILAIPLASITYYRFASEDA